MIILGEYDVVYMVHFFTGVILILTYGFFETYKKEMERMNNKNGN